jgi:ferredoxin
MLQLALDKKNIQKLIAAMLKEGAVRAPVETAQGVAFATVSAGSVLTFEYTNVKLPPKRELFPQCEALSRFGPDGVIEEKTAGGKTILFGVRPCDARAIAYLDKVFVDGGIDDPYYQARRNNTLIISLACSAPADTCFCASFNASSGAGPADTMGSDAIAYNLGNSHVFESASENGETFLDKNKNLFRTATPAELQAVKTQESEAREKMTTITVNGAPEALDRLTAAKGQSLWNSVAETCLGCGACTFLCPTCHCFDLFDDKQGDGGKRLRVHDACMFEQFVKEASGNNPRATTGERMRQRIMHKFSYAPRNFNTIFCVGCGRCITNCPSNIDLRETIAKVTA